VTSQIDQIWYHNNFVMLVELAIADGYSGELTNSLLELVSDKQVVREHLPRHYTGITQSNIAIAKMLVLDLPWLKDFLANSLVTTFKQDPRVGYGEEFDRLLATVRDGNELIESINSDDHQDHPAVRAVPVGILASPEQVIKASISHAAITNNTPDGWNTAIAVGLMSHYFLYRLGKKEQLIDFLTIYIDTKWLQTKSIAASSPILTATQQTIDAVIKHHSLSQLLQYCHLSEHRKLISAIAVAAAACSEEYQQDLPQCLFDHLENEQYGRDYLLSLDQKWRNLIK
jgi:ADP-ribosyl-[dinitrogen reductase] hydrolase